METELAARHTIIVNQVGNGFRTLCRAALGQCHNLVEYHQEVLHAKHHVNGEERYNQRECQITELLPSCRPVQPACLINILRHGLKAGDINNSVHRACGCKKIVAPAMNTHMYENPVVQDNIQKLIHYGMEVLVPDTGYLACGDVGAGKMPSEQVLLEYILREIRCEKDLAGMKVLVTAGPTREKMDPVRFITNYSTGKMGYAIAKQCMQRGADVTLVTGKTQLPPPMFVRVVETESARDMFEAVKECYTEQDIIVKSAAVADYRPVSVAGEKMKKRGDSLSVSLERTEDILQFLGDNRREGQFICGFSMETENMVENSRAKLEKKHVDMIVANNLKQEGAGFGTDTNIVTLITRDGCEELPMMGKDEVAGKIVDSILKMRRICF